MSWSLNLLFVCALGLVCLGLRARLKLQLRQAIDAAFARGYLAGRRAAFESVPRFIDSEGLGELGGPEESAR